MENRGYLIRVFMGGTSPSMQIIAYDLPRSRLLEIAKLLLGSVSWVGPRQLIFVDRSGIVEVWNENTR